MYCTCHSQAIINMISSLSCKYNYGFLHGTLTHYIWVMDHGDTWICMCLVCIVPIHMTLFHLPKDLFHSVVYPCSCHLPVSVVYALFATVQFVLSDIDMIYSPNLASRKLFFQTSTMCCPLTTCYTCVVDSLSVYLWCIMC